MKNSIKGYIYTNIKVTKIDYSKDYYKGLAGIYFNLCLNTIIKMGKLKQEKGLIFDFGCGVGHLKRKLQKTVVGYDIIDELSDVDDYTTLKPAVIVCNAILEHLDENELETVIDNFRKMNINAKLITSIPTENWFSKVGLVITGLKTAHDAHKINLKQINRILSKKCILLKRKKVVTLTEISLWRFRKD